MDDKNVDTTVPLRMESRQERIKEECKKIAHFFEASSSAMFESQNGLILHFEFDDAEKFEKFAEHLKSCGLLAPGAVPEKSGKVH